LLYNRAIISKIIKSELNKPIWFAFDLKGTLMIRNVEYVIAAYAILSSVLVIYTTFIHIKLHKVNNRIQQISNKNKDE